MKCMIHSMYKDDCVTYHTRLNVINLDSLVYSRIRHSQEYSVDS